MNSTHTHSTTVYTEALLAREQAELATLNKLRLLANVSQDLCTPLNSIIGYVELIAKDIHGLVAPEQQSDLARIRLNQQHLLELVDDLLTYVQAGTARVNEIVEVSVHAAMQQAMSLMENSLSRKSIRHEPIVCDPDIAALCDQERVTQILLNLLANAVKFTARGGHITTSCEATDDQVHLRVKDSGIGIDASKLGQIFEPFVQLDESRSVESGVGLGLSVSRDLARSMHGELSVESTRGEGSCFTLTLPRAQPGM